MSKFFVTLVLLGFFLQITAFKFRCLNGQDPSKLTKKQYLIEFAKGPCSPTVLIPGTLSTKLTLTIDCKMLQKEEPEIFQKCGWNSCSKKFWEFWKHVP